MTTVNWVYKIKANRYINYLWCNKIIIIYLIFTKTNKFKKGVKNKYLNKIIIQYNFILFLVSTMYIMSTNTWCEKQCVNQDISVSLNNLSIN